MHFLSIKVDRRFFMRLYFKVHCVFFILIILCGSLSVNAQKKKKKSSRENSSSITNIQKKKGHSPGEQIIQIYCTGTRQAYSGNACAGRAAHRMGFQYILHYADGTKSSSSKFYNWVHNQGAYFQIAFKNGPFWKHRFRRLMKECKS